MFGALPIGIYMDLARMDGCMYQMPLFETPPHYEIKEEYVCDVFKGWSCKLNGTGGEKSGMISYGDHPAFTALREHLASSGYINIQKQWSNGDRVTNAFYLNDLLFLEGDQFPCAAAMRFDLKRAEKTTKEKLEKLVYLPVKVRYNDNEKQEEELW